MGSSRWVASLGVAIVVGGLVGACGGGTQAPTTFDGQGDSGTGRDGGGGGGHLDGSGFRLSEAGGGDSTTSGEAGALTITPANKTLNVTMGGAAPTLNYQAYVGGVAVPVSWSIDRGELGTIGAASGLFTAGETVGGTANITATYGKETASTPVTIALHLVENGGYLAGDGGVGDGGGGDGGGGEGGTEGGVGAGGAGGVGGNGPGGPVSMSTETLLEGPTTADSTIGWLYPYDATVWPRGILAPLLQWNAGAYNFDAVYIHISEAAFDYKGFFASTATPFINSPVTQDAWTAMAYSNGGEPVTVTLVFHDPVSGKAIGPISETWNIALGTLEGTVYYNSYGTHLATNYCCTYPDNGGGAPGNQPFGGATLAIKGGSTSPVLTAGSNTECRVCHSVAAGGSTLVTQQGSSYPTSSSYDLQTLVETTMLPKAEGLFAWPAVYPDGTFLFSDSSPLAGSTTASPSALYSVPSGTAIPSTGLPTNLSAACPAFSPDGTHVAFNFYAGEGVDGGPSADKKSLAWLDYAQATNQFSGMDVIYTPSGGTAVWPSFMPTNDAVIFELETVNNGRDFAGTRSTCDSSGTCSDTGTQGELWWIDQKTKTPTRLDNANGYMYLPTNANNHMSDWELNYEPTVNPVPSGGYAWVVFTSRRIYGNIATINPYWSDPRYHDISTTPTTKKLWVAAIDLSPTPGKDPSHPAFYLPAQELLAGNARGYWVVNPCLGNGETCMTGDECCGGYCRAGDGGGLVCGSVPSGCSQEYEKCTTTSDCCGASIGVQCIDNICSVAVPPTPK